MSNEAVDVWSWYDQFLSVIADYRSFARRDPGEVQLSPPDWAMLVKQSGNDPELAPSYGQLFGINASSNPDVEQVRIRLLCRKTGGVR